MHGRRIFLASLAASLVALGAIAVTAPHAAHAQAPAVASAVTISDFGFHPATITVAPGTVVTWTNKDDEPHTVAADDRSYHSTPMDTDEHFSHTYTAPGEYHYFCTLHPHMTGVVIVRNG